jgi:hypothetical protein
MSSLIPGNVKTYIFNNERDYYQEYQKSYFAITTKKAGWDCLRHYEIMANGCITFFQNIEKCPVLTLSLLPKELILQSNELYNECCDKVMTPEQVIQCNHLIQSFIHYVKSHLTTDKMAEYILREIGFNIKETLTPPRILFLSPNADPDYLRCLTLHGFKTLLGASCHDFPMVSHLYKNIKGMNYDSLYGKGFTYTQLLERNEHDDELDSHVEQDIKDQKYDLVIYGSLHRGKPFVDLVFQHYEPSRIVFLCGEDIGCCVSEHMSLLQKGCHVFVREL